ncbi:hypothetical protein BJP40_06580 [Streptomyces sp. CC53]|uniref:hypothetical protein n=1 Tax=Streptomyces sp. CC53 TaxID=1906740 RepID=UPI0008DC8CCE|nr:hypothetical protein [Streptomyces sp. CC53]OII61188.1 hypothetical protein BJP40_06580 [Streptomyces sp. CC53]
MKIKYKKDGTVKITMSKEEAINIGGLPRPQDETMRALWLNLPTSTPGSMQVRFETEMTIELERQRIPESFIYRQIHNP